MKLYRYDTSAQTTMDKPGLDAFFSVLTWLRRERTYVKSKWGERNQHDRGTSDYDAWKRDVEMYLHRTSMLMDGDTWTPLAAQALAKGASTICALLEMLAKDGILPAGGYPSGTICR